jgi:DNA-binding PadR family transcriptional regulator
MNNYDKTAQLTLLLLYLTSWKEKGDELHRAWKGYDFDILNKLEEDGLISQSKTAKSIYLTAKGMSEAKRLNEIINLSDAIGGR